MCIISESYPSLFSSGCSYFINQVPVFLGFLLFLWSGRDGMASISMAVGSLFLPNWAYPAVVSPSLIFTSLFTFIWYRGIHRQEFDSVNYYNPTVSFYQNTQRRYLRPRENKHALLKFYREIMSGDDEGFALKNNLINKIISSTFYHLKFKSKMNFSHFSEWINGSTIIFSMP